MHILLSIRTVVTFLLPACATMATKNTLKLPVVCVALQVEVTAADSSNPGIPPSSLMSFLRVKPSVQGVVLAEFDQGFTNPYYASRFDNGSTISADGIAATAAVLAAAAHRLAGGDPATLQVTAVRVPEYSRKTTCPVFYWLRAALR